MPRQGLEVEKKRRMLPKVIEPTATLVTDKDYLPILLALLSIAKSSIDILAFSFAIGSAGGKLNTESSPYKIAQKLKDLKKKHGKKLRIRLYIEGLRETSDRNQVTAKFLADAGVEVVYGATHAKGFCIDEKYVLFGSTNLTHQSILKNNEANLFLDNKVVATEFTKYFNHLWLGGTHGGVELNLPMIADGDFKKILLQMINTAKSRLEFSIYFFHQADIEKALIKAHERGVKITGFVHQHGAFALSYIRRNRSTVKRLREAGIKDIYFSVPNKFSHAKYLVKDRKEIALGTGNWLDEDINIHPQLYIYLTDITLAKSLVKHIAWQISHQATED
ncbi:MAG: phospholipase D-like domain-containing protein [Bdellovibrionota bacterium]